MTQETVVPTGYSEVYCRYITRNGKRIYPKKARYFHFFVKDRKSNTKK